MTVPCPVNIVWDISIGALSHGLWVPGTPAPAGFSPSLEMVATQMWTAGYVLGKNQFTTDVLTCSMPTCQENHDLGPLIPDITYVFVNLYYPLMWPFSSRKMTFAASTVKMNKKAVGCAAIFPPFPMMTCGDPITAPTAVPLTNLLHRVFVGMTFGDIVLGIVNIGVSMAIDAIFEWVPPFSKIGDAFKDRIGNVANEILGKLGLTPKSLAKKAVSALSGWVVGASAHAVDPNQSMPDKIGVSVGVLNREVGIQIGGDPNDPGFHSLAEVGGPNVGVTNATFNDPLNILPGI